MHRYAAATARLVIKGMMLVLFAPFVVSVCILIFRLTGRMGPGEMQPGMETPGYGGLLLFQLVCILLLAAGGAARLWLARRAAPAPPKG